MNTSNKANFTEEEYKKTDDDGVVYRKIKSNGHSGHIYIVAIALLDNGKKIFDNKTINVMPND
jgi:hypothetical protein